MNNYYKDFFSFVYYGSTVTIDPKLQIDPIIPLFLLYMMGEHWGTQYMDFLTCVDLILQNAAIKMTNASKLCLGKQDRVKSCKSSE